METKTRRLIEDFVAHDLASPCSVSVIGDVMIDEYYQVTMDRISPEFPIPVMKSKRDSCKRVPGGAANVAMQFSRFNVTVYLTGVIGQVMPLMPRKIQGHAPVDCGLPIPIKKRFYQGDFPLARWDVEEHCYGSSDSFGWLWEGFALKETKVTVFSDYGKGLFDSGWHKPHLDGRISIVDPKGEVERWRGCTILKPNSVEAKALTGEDDWLRQAWKLKTRTMCRDVIITDGANGVAGLAGDQPFEYRPQKHAVVNSVIGAGDCFMAFLAMAVSQGMATQDAVVVAYEAGAVYVQSKHNRPLKPAELLAGKGGERVVFTNGCFDIMHAGHIQTLEFAKNQGDILVVGVNTDESVKRLKGKQRPVNKLADRIKVLSAMKCVDCVMSFDENTPIDLIKYVRPDVIVKGGDYKPEDVVGYDLAEVIIAPMLDGLSTTGMLARIN